MRESTGKKFYCSQDVIECLNLSTSEWNQRRAISNNPQSDTPHPCVDARIGVVQIGTFINLVVPTTRLIRAVLSI